MIYRKREPHLTKLGYNLKTLYKQNLNTSLKEVSSHEKKSNLAQFDRQYSLFTLQKAFINRGDKRPSRTACRHFQHSQGLMEKEFQVCVNTNTFISVICQYLSSVNICHDLTSVSICQYLTPSDPTSDLLYLILIM